jgi:mitochondrial intermembrane space import and assembly protein 40
VVRRSLASSLSKENGNTTIRSRCRVYRCRAAASRTALSRAGQLQIFFFIRATSGCYPPPAMYNLPGSESAAPAKTDATAREKPAAEDAADEFAAASVAELAISSRKRTEEKGGHAREVGGGALLSAAAVPAATVAADSSSDGNGGDERVLTREEEIEEALSCPCIDAMREGPCGNDFIAAYRCFLESESEPKGMDCVPQFATMQSCMAEHPEEYNLDDDSEDPLSMAPAERRPLAEAENADLASIATAETQADQHAPTAPTEIDVNTG